MNKIVRIWILAGLLAGGMGWTARGASGMAAGSDTPVPASSAVEKQPTPGKHAFGDRLAGKLRKLGWPDEVVVGVISALPVVELRGAVPVGMTSFKMPWWKALLIAVAGNMIPVPFIIWLLGPISRASMKTRGGKRFFDWLFARTRKKTAEIEKYETLGLAIFVAIPLPATGAWTGAMAAWMLGMSWKHSLLSILLGVVIAGLIMVTLSWLGWIGAAIFGTALMALAVGALSQMIKREKSKTPPTP